MSLYADSDGVLTLIERKVLADGVASRVQTASLIFQFTAAQSGSDGLVVMVDDDGSGTAQGAQEECDESDNIAVWLDAVCP